MFKNSGRRASPVAALARVPTWSTWTEAVAVVTHPTALRRTLTISIAIGTVFFFMNQLPALLAGQVTVTFALKTALTYVVPFCTSNYGILAATRLPVIQPEVSATTSTGNPVGGVHRHRREEPM